MIFFFKTTGESILTYPERVFQGSNKANTIYCGLPCSGGSLVNVAFSLANGEQTILHPMTKVTEGELDEILDGEGNNYSIWKFDLPVSITAHYGMVTVQFFVTGADGEVMVTASCDFEVEKGVVPSETPTDSEDYQTLLNLVRSIITATDGKLDKVNTVNSEGKSYAYVSDNKSSIQMTEVTNSDLANTLVKRDETGKTMVGTPVESDDEKTATNVEYVKDSKYNILPYLVSLNIPASENPVMSRFSNLPSLQKLVIGEGVTTISDNAFANDSCVTEITIAPSVTSVGKNAFVDTAYYKNLSNWNDKEDLLYIDDVLIKFGNNVPWQQGLNQAPAIKEGTRVIADYAMNNIYNRNGVIFPSTLKHIGKEAFHYTSLGNLNHKIIIPDSVESIGDSAFSSTQISYIKIGNGLKRIPLLMLQNNQHLTTVDFSGRTTVPELASQNAFALVNSDCKIVVPDALYDEWTTADKWKDVTLSFVRESEYVQQ